MVAHLLDPWNDRGLSAGGVRVTAGNAATTANIGEYILNGLLAGNYTVRPGGSDCVLVPSSEAVVLARCSQCELLSMPFQRVHAREGQRAVSRFISGRAAAIVSTAGQFELSGMGTVDDGGHGYERAFSILRDERCERQSAFFRDAEAIASPRSANFQSATTVLSTSRASVPATST
jgi:hypothetical protein